LAYPEVKFLGHGPASEAEEGCPVDQVAADVVARKAQSSQRIPAEHAIALLKWRRTLQRLTGRRDVLPETIRAVTGLASDRAAGR
jgi:hypothetical protein